MTGEPAQPGIAGDTGDVPVVPPAPGGTIEDYLKLAATEGRSYVIADNGREAWIPCSRGELQRWPVECTDEVDKATLRGLLRRKGVWIVNYQLDVTKGSCTPNCFDYVCSDPQYDIERLHKNARRDIRRGLRSFVVRRLSWDELYKHGYPAHLDTTLRHGYTPPEPCRLQQFADRVRNSPCHEVWGAWRGEDLAAWMVFIKIDNYAVIDNVRSCSAAHRDCPNNAVLYLVTRQLLIEEKRQFVSLGLSSVQADPNRLSMHKYKVRMGYEARPRFRRFVLHPLLRPLICTRSASWFWDKLLARRHDNEKLRKVAGMSRLISGREPAPLAWADAEKETDND